MTDISFLRILFVSIGIITICNYFTKLIKYVYIAITIKTNNKGIKELKYQEYNPIWNRYVLRR